MKKVLLLGLLLSCLQVFPQQKQSSPDSYKRTLDNRKKITAVEAEIEQFIANNISKYKLTSEKVKAVKKSLESIKADSDLAQSGISLSTMLQNEKKAELRKLYLSKNPELKPVLMAIARPAPGVVRFACDNGGFESLLTDDYDFTSRAYYGSPYESVDCSLDTDTGFITLTTPALANSFGSLATLTDRGTGTTPIVDPTLHSMTPAVDLPVANTGRYGVKLNNPTTPGTDGKLVTKMVKTFFADAPRVSFSFLFICENPASHIPENQPRFIARLYDVNDNLLDEFCLVSDVANTIMFNNARTAANPMLYTGWQCTQLSTQGVEDRPILADREVRLEISVNDCTQGAHFSTLYVDDICNVECNSPVYGQLNLDFTNPALGNCPVFPLEVCGTYEAPHSINTTPTIYATYESLSMDILQNGALVSTIPAPSQYTTVQGAQNTFCFVLQESNFGTAPITGDFEFRVSAVFNAAGTNFTKTVTSAIPGPDISFNDCNCCDLCCPETQVVTIAVPQYITQQKQAAVTLTAKNTINAVATAQYHAGTTVLLKEPFVAKYQSNIHFYIAGCSPDAESRPAVEVTSPNFIFKEEADAVAALDRIDSDDEVRISPNPNNGIFKVLLGDYEQGSLLISDLNGKTVYETVLLKDGKKEIEINIKEWPKGVYILQLTKDKELVTKKIIKN